MDGAPAHDEDGDGLTNASEISDDDRDGLSLLLEFAQHTLCARVAPGFYDKGKFSNCDDGYYYTGGFPGVRSFNNNMDGDVCDDGDVVGDGGSPAPDGDCGES